MSKCNLLLSTVLHEGDGNGQQRYVLIDLDNGGKRITVEEAVQGLKPFVQTEQK